MAKPVYPPRSGRGPRRAPARQRTSLMPGDFRGENANIFDVAVVFGVVHAIADDELVRNGKAHVVGLDGNEAALRLVEAGGNLKRRRLVLEHHAAKVA